MYYFKYINCYNTLMLIVILIMFLGVVVGFLIHKQKNILRTVDSATSYAIWLLLFLLGVSIGTNKIIISNIGTLGLQAIFLTFGAVSGSVLLSYLLYIRFFKHES